MAASASKFCFAWAAYGPLGSREIHFWHASAVPGGLMYVLLSPSCLKSVSPTSAVPSRYHACASFGSSRVTFCKGATSSLKSPLFVRTMAMFFQHLVVEVGSSAVALSQLAPASATYLVAAAGSVVCAAI